MEGQCLRIEENEGHYVRTGELGDPCLRTEQLEGHCFHIEEF